MKKLSVGQIGLLLLMAVGSSAGCDRSSGQIGGVIRTIMECDERRAGVYYICWDQTNSQGEFVDPGQYWVTVLWNTSSNVHLELLIDDQNPSLSPSLCDSVPQGGLIPTAFSASLNSREYHPGDTVQVELNLAMRCSVEVLIRHYSTMEPEFP